MLRRATPSMPVAILLFLALLAGAMPPAAAGEPRIELDVMSFNILYGGDEWDFDHNHWCYRPRGCPETMEKVLDVIRASGADVVGMQEGTGNGCRLAQRLGWYCSGRLQILSRYPLIDPPGGNSIYIFAEVVPGRFVALANVHLPSDPYGPYYVRDGEPLETVLELERTTRLPAIAPQIAVLPDLAAAGIPVFLTGDFNSPSHLDWTQEVAAVREVVRYPVVWPVAKSLADAGFRDSYRDVYPDPVAKPGFTWTPPSSPESVPDEVDDRIDWVLSSGPARAIASRILGETGFPDADITFDPYPTDHRGVVSTFRTTPADPGPFVAVGERRVFVGDDLAVRFHAEPDDERVALLPAGGGSGDAVASRLTGGGVDGTATFGTSDLAPGAYEAALVDGNHVISRSPFWVYEPGTRPQVETAKSVYELGERIRVSWSAAPGNKWDWLGVYKPGDGPKPLAEICTGGYCGNLHYLLYEYTSASTEGTTTFDRYSAPGYTTWPLQPGKYEVRLLEDDGYRLLGISNTFKVVRPDSS